MLENNHVLLLNSELRNIHQTQRILLHVAPRLYVMSLGKACLLFTPRKLSQTVNTSDLYVGGFGSNLARIRTVLTRFPSLLSVQKIVRFYVQFEY